MGPGGGKTDGNYKTVKPGEVPVFSESSSPSLYRRLLLDWISYQELTTNKEKKLSYGQQPLTIITNVRGSAGQRLHSNRRRISASFTEQEFVLLVEELLEKIDPVDREASFLETAQRWRDVMAKRHGTNQTYDKYWSECCSLCYKFGQAHGDVASSAGVQELVALNCIIHANLRRPEFGVVLDHSMRHPNSYVTTMANIDEGRWLPTQVVFIRSGRDTFSQLSSSRRYHAESSYTTTHEAQSRTGTQGAGDSGIVTADSSGVGLADTSADGTELVAFSQIQIDDTLWRIQKAEEKLSEFASKLENASDQAEAAETAAASASALGNETVETLSTLRGKLGAAKMSETRARESFGSLSELVSRTDVAQARIDGANLKHGGSEAMLSMESVRMALRSIDQGELAIQGANKKGVSRAEQAAPGTYPKRDNLHQDD